MPTTPYTPPPPTTQNSNLSAADYQWALIVQNLAPLYEVDTSAGSYAETPPTAGIETSGQTGQCKEITYVKTSSDSNTYTLNGVEGGPYTLKTQWDFFKIKSDGTNWYLDGIVSSGSATPTGPAGGDLSGTYPDPTVAKVNGAAVPLSAPIVGTNASRQIVDVSGNALALANGSTATTQAAHDDSTKLATTAYVDGEIPASLPPSGPAGGDLSGTYPDPTVDQVNGAAVPASATVLGSNGSHQLIDNSAATLSNNTSGTAANLSGTPALPNGTTATTQAALDNSTKLATTAYADAAVGVEKARAEAAEALLAPLASPALTGSPTAPTQTAGDDSTKLATTAYVDAPVAATGTPAINIPFINIVPDAAPAISVFGIANTQQAIMFVMSEDFTISNVAVYIGTGVNGASMGIAIYSADGMTKLAYADSFAVGVAQQGVLAVALHASVTLKKKTTYWLAWTATTATTLTCSSILQAAAGGSNDLYNAGVVRNGNSGTATSGGATNATLGTISAVRNRIPLLYFY